MLAEDAIDEVDHDGSLVVWKTAPTVGELLEFLPQFGGGNIFELGIFAGGSVALTVMLAEPRRMVAIDLLPAAAPTLARFMEDRGLDDVVRLHFGVDQADAGRLRELVSTEFDGPLDLVYDDASHVYGPTRATFETLFPRLRPGGVYLIEDWTSEQGFLSLLRGGTQDDYAAALRKSLAAALDDPDDLRYPFARFLVDRRLGHLVGVDHTPGEETPFDPLPRLIHELVQLRAEHRDVIRSIQLRWNWATIERGVDDLPDEWRLSDYVRDDFEVLTRVTHE